MFLSEGAFLANFADDTAVMAIGDDVVDATENLQRAADEINNRTR